jgi:O-antigen/teichoic acid export membrane protein
MSVSRPLARLRSPLVRDAAWSLAGEGGYAAGLLVTAIVLARLGPPEALGQYTLGLAIATPVILLTNLHLRPAYVVDDGGRFADYLGLRRATIPIALALTGAVALLGGYDWRTVAMVLAVGGLRAWESLSDILLAPAQRAHDLGALGRSRALRGLYTAAGVGVGLWVTGDALVGMALALALLGALSLGPDAHAARRFASPGPPAPASARLALVRRTWPIGLAAALLGAAAQTPAVVLEHTHDVIVLGQLGVVMSVAYVAQLLNVALGNAAIPRLAAARRQGHGLARLLGRLLLLVAVCDGLLVLGVLVLGGTYLRVAFGAGHAALVPELVLAAAAAGVAGLANMLSQALTAQGRFGQQLAINAVGLGASVGLALWLVPAAGLRGAMWALMAMAALRLAIYAGALLWPGKPGHAEEIGDHDARAGSRCPPPLPSPLPG